MAIKINSMLTGVLPGQFVMQTWLTGHGISPQLAAKYVSSRWLQKISSGVYIRLGKKAEWPSAVDVIEHQRKLPIHLAGLSSLIYQGRAHYLKQYEDCVWLSVEGRAKVPKWFDGLSELNSEALNKNFPDWHYISLSKVNLNEDRDFISVDVQGVELRASRLELAAFEVLEEVSKKMSFVHAAELFQGLTDLSPRRVQSLLERSRSVRTNRLFLFFGHYYQHPWSKRLDENSIELGKGKRQIVQGGRLDKRYMITVPDSFMERGISHG